MRGFEVDDLKAPLQHQRIVAIKFNGVGTGFRERKADQAKIQFHDRMDIRKLNLAIDLRHHGIALVVNDPQLRRALATPVRE